MRDLVVIGAGLRGLAAAAVAARSGLRTLVLERWFKLGGSALTEQVTLPGYLHNVRPWVAPSIDSWPALEHVGELEQVMFVSPSPAMAAVGSGEAALLRLGVEPGSRLPLVVGGSGRLVQALQKVLYAHRGRVLTSQTASRLVVEHGRVAAVETAAGDRFTCERVVSTVPEQTEFPWFGLHIALATAPALPVTPTPLYLGADDAVVISPSAHDPLHAPPGRHAVSVLLAAPVAPEGEARAWLQRDLRERWADQALDRLLILAPNLRREDVLWTYAAAPFDLGARFPALPMAELTGGREAAGLYCVTDAAAEANWYREVQDESG